MKDAPPWTTLARTLYVAVLLAPWGCFGSGDIGTPSPLPTSNPPAAAVSSTPELADTPEEVTVVPAAISTTAATGGVDATPVDVPTPRNMNMTPEKPPRLTNEHRAAFPTDAAVAAKRQELIEFLWGSDGFPSTKLPSSIDKSVASPILGLGNVERVDTLHIQMDSGMVSLAHHFIPAVGKRNRLVIVHHGHATTFDDDAGLVDVGYGLQRTIKNLLLDGYSVVAMYMPGCLPPQVQCYDHKAIVDLPTTGSGMKFFLEPVATVLNYLETQSQVDEFPAYKDFNMIGLSGGGWTTTVYAALDPRIKVSVPVAGSLPFSLRAFNSIGDEEQTHAPFYDIAGYTDLYVLGGYGFERRQVQVLNRHDDCCFGDREYDPIQAGKPYTDALRSYELEVRQRLQQLSVGSFRLEIDEAAPTHMISWNTVASIVLNELGGAKKSAWIGAGQRFERGDDGNLVRIAAGSIENTAIPMVGVPAVAEREGGGYDVFFRDPQGTLRHAYGSGSDWAVEPLTTVVITDPVLLASGQGRVDVAALTTDYLPRRWRSEVGTMASEAIGTAPRAFGAPLLTSDADGQLLIFLRGWDRTSYRLHEDEASAWVEEVVSQLPVLSTGITSTHRGPTMP